MCTNNVIILQQCASFDNLAHFLVGYIFYKYSVVVDFMIDFTADHSIVSNAFVIVIVI